MWVWIALGSASFALVVLLLLVGFARGLALIAREFSEFYESEFWATWESPRETDDVHRTQTAARARGDEHTLVGRFLGRR